MKEKLSLLREKVFNSTYITRFELRYITVSKKKIINFHNMDVAKLRQLNKYTVPVNREFSKLIE